MAKIRQSNLDNSIVTGLGELTSVANGDQTIIYDVSTGTLKKISQTNFLNFPVVSSVSPTSVVSGDGTGNYTFTITGTGFTATSASLINNSGSVVSFDTVTIDSATQITGVIAKSSLPGSGEPYDVKVTAAAGLSDTLENQINIDQSPTFNTASGSLGTISDTARTSTTLEVIAFDPESAGNVTFELASGSLPSGATTTTVNEDGVSKFRISGFSAVGGNTTSTFTVRAADINSNTSTREFTITVTAPVIESFTSSGTFSVPSGVTAINVLVVGGGGGGGGGDTNRGSGGGGGAGGLIFFPSYPVTPGGTISVTVACGGGAGTASTDLCTSKGGNGNNSIFGSPGNPGLSPTGEVLTAVGGGGGSGPGGNGQPGGSGGGAHAGSNGTGGSATQPTQPGNSGTYGFGNAGGPSLGGPNAGGSGGGAGGAGAVGSPSVIPGGIGRAYTIADGTTPVYYAGGGGFGGHAPTAPTGGAGGQGGGGAGGSVGSNNATQGQANKGGGGGGGMENPGAFQGANGGKGIVIVAY